MAPPASYYARNALDAELHIQVEVDGVSLPSVTPGEAVVEGRVARVFRGDPSLLSSRISFEVSCLREGDDSGPPGEVRWTDADALAKAKVIEVYLTPWKGGYGVVSGLSFLLETVTDTPRRPFTEEDARNPADAPPGWSERLSSVGTWLLMLLFFGSGLAGFGYAFWALLK
ncbi:MFS transporter [Myxococcus qinghaiensis]|uniref:MFS transporter n=1 Tax=Myxococcus qinghaiensis TaxID=2906758 RepID=UPI0020A77F2C|nr:MFS transporter [Myxococcus qinghaiensis]MCP3170137.1 MFS transporter [Myxococcus qinghaiensis]